MHDIFHPLADGPSSPLTPNASIPIKLTYHSYPFLEFYFMLYDVHSNE